MAKLYAPDGETPIVGTFERVPGCALLINDGITRNSDGTFEFDYEGETNIYWDEQVTVLRRPEDASKAAAPQRVFVDEDGDGWLESELILREDEEL